MRRLVSHAWLVLACVSITACSNLVSIESNGASIELGPQLQTSVVLDGAGQVVHQEPAPGVGQILAQTGYVATVQVSSADRSGTVVPDVVNRTLDVARQTLESRGFVVQVRVECPSGDQTSTGSSQRSGVVWQQTPDGQARVPVHSPVVLYTYPS
ncbi:MAG: PASTA domain-containing protein [Euzebya sp.]